MLTAVLHAPGFVGCWRSFFVSGFNPDHLGACIALTIAMLFFALKIYDIPLLRWRTDRRAWITIGLAVALVHVDVLTPGTDLTFVPQCTEIVAGTLLATGLAPVRRVFGGMSLKACSSVRRQISPAIARETFWLDAFRPRCWVLASHIYALRAPPA